TRWPRDWSSDVCSSDLEGPLSEQNGVLRIEISEGDDLLGLADLLDRIDAGPDDQLVEELKGRDSRRCVVERIRSLKDGHQQGSRSEEHTSELQSRGHLV